jgi:hypothetical protein
MSNVTDSNHPPAPSIPRSPNEDRRHYRFLIYFSFFIQSMDLLLIASNSYALGASVSHESSYLPWRDFLVIGGAEPPTEVDAATSPSQLLNYYYTNYPGHLQNCTKGCPTKFDFYTQERNIAIPTHFDKYNARCLDENGENTFHTATVFLTIPIIQLAVITLIYKLLKVKLHEHSYGSWGHITSVYNVRYDPVYRILVGITCFATSLYVLGLLSVSDSQAKSSPTFVVSVMSAALNIVKCMTKLTTTGDVTLEFPRGESERIKVGSFSCFSNCESVKAAVEDGLMIFLTTGSKAVLVNNLKILPTDCDTLQSVVLHNAKVVRQSLSTFVWTLGKSSEPAPLEFIERERVVSNFGGIVTYSVSIANEIVNPLAKPVSFFVEMSAFNVAILNCFEIVLSITSSKKTVVDDFDFDETLQYTNANGDAEELQIEAFALGKCRMTDLIMPFMKGQDYGDFPNNSRGFHAFVLVGLAITVAMILTAKISRVFYHRFGTFGFCQGIVDAPKNRYFKSIVIKTAFVVTLAAGYGIFMYEKGGGLPPFDTAFVLLNGWANVMSLLFEKVPSSCLVTMAHSPECDAVIIPAMSIFSSPAFWYEQVQTGLMMTIAKDDDAILRDVLEMSRSDIHLLVKAMTEMDVHKESDSGHCHVVHPKSTGKLAKMLSDKRGKSFIKQEKSTSFVKEKLTNKWKLPNASSSTPNLLKTRDIDAQL